MSDYHDRVSRLFDCGASFTDEEQTHLDYYMNRDERYGFTKDERSIIDELTDKYYAELEAWSAKLKSRVNA